MLKWHENTVFPIFEEVQGVYPRGLRIGEGDESDETLLSRVPSHRTRDHCVSEDSSTEPIVTRLPMSMP